MAKMKLRRPTKEMMLAVNAAIDGKKKEVNSLVTANKLSRRELQTRVELRDGEKYDLEKGRGPRVVKKATAPSGDIVSMLNGRTKAVTLVRLEARVKELLVQKPKGEVTKVREAAKNYDKKLQELHKMEALLGL